MPGARIVSEAAWLLAGQGVPACRARVAEELARRWLNETSDLFEQPLYAAWHFALQGLVVSMGESLSPQAVDEHCRHVIAARLGNLACLVPGSG